MQEGCQGAFEQRGGSSVRLTRDVHALAGFIAGLTFIAGVWKCFHRAMLIFTRSHALISLSTLICHEACRDQRTLRCFKPPNASSLSDQATKLPPATIDLHGFVARPDDLYPQIYPRDHLE
jgi:hypothetical protein